MDLANMFLTQCKINYLKGITPSDFKKNDTEDYMNLIDIGKLYIKKGQLENFSYFLGEGQYFVALWAAHIIIEYGDPDKQLYRDCLDTIIEYSDNPLSLKVSNEEKLWLQQNKKNDI